MRWNARRDGKPFHIRKPALPPPPAFFSGLDRSPPLSHFLGRDLLANRSVPNLRRSRGARGLEPSRKRMRAW
ncbi:hypothetical protein IMZ48_01770 [Candidatus Bathyarchaeota archaeon]|nr:hypothetical protein [Candidatus Bathyarchaeota archaeon]